MKRYRFAFVFSLWTMILYGAIDAMRSATGPLLQAQTHISYAQLGSLFAANSIGYLLGSLPSGLILHRAGLKRTLVFGSLTMGITLGFVPLAHVFILLWGAFLLYGVTMGWLEIGVNAVVPSVADSTQAESTGFNLLHGFYGVGATVFPTIVIWIATASGTWRAPFIVVGIITLMAALTILRYRFPVLKESSEPSRDTGSSSKKAYRSPLLYALVLSIMLYVVAEGGTAAWLPTYLVHAGHMNPLTSSWYLTGFYVTFTVGRLSGPLWVHKIGSYTSIVASSIFSIVLFGMAMALPGMPWLFIVSGFGFAVTFPTIVHISSQTFSNETGKVLGLLFTCAGIGGIFVSWLIGLVASFFGIYIAFWIVPVAMCLVLVTIFIAIFLDKVHHSPGPTTTHPASL